MATRKLVQAVWKKCKTRGKVPLGRSSHGLLALGRHAFVFGGEHEPRVPIGSTIHRLDLDTMEWEDYNADNEDSQPHPVNAAAISAIDDNIYVFGGRTGITMGEGNTDEMFSFNINTRKWSKLTTSGKRPAPRSYHAMVSLNKKLYMFGGCSDKGRLNDLYSFDVTSCQWEEQPRHDAIEGRGGPGLVAVGECIYVVAGFAGRETNDVHKFDTVTKSWTTLSFGTPLPPRSVFGIASDGQHIVVIGGEVDPSSLGHEGAGNFSNECFVLNIKEPNDWIKVNVSGDVPEPRGWFQAAYCNFSKQFIIFGGNSETNARLNDTHLLQIT